MWCSRQIPASCRLQHQRFTALLLSYLQQLWQGHEVGDKLDHRLNTDVNSISNKYRKAKLQRTLKRKLKEAWNKWSGTNFCRLEIWFKAHFKWSNEAKIIMTRKLANPEKSCKLSHSHITLRPKVSLACAHSARHSLIAGRYLPFIVPPNARKLHKDKDSNTLSPAKKNWNEG